MKRILLLTLVLPLLGFGQNIVVSTPNTLVFYYGLNNPVQCSVEGFSCDEIVLACMSPDVQLSGNGCNYFILTWNWNPVKFSILNKMDSVVLDTFSIAVCEVPAPEVRFHRERFNEIIKDSIIVSNPVWEKFNVPFKVIEFDLYFYHDKKEQFYVTNTGAVFNDETLRKIDQLRRKDELIIRRIVLDVDGQTLSYIVYDRYIIH